MILLNNALNEVCNGLDQWEFETRMGKPREEVVILLNKVHARLKTIRSTHSEDDGSHELAQ